MKRHMLIGVTFLFMSGTAIAEPIDPDAKSIQEITMAATELIGLAEICRAPTEAVETELTRLRQVKNLEEKRDSLERAAQLFGQSAVGCPYLLRPRETALR